MIAINPCRHSPGTGVTINYDLTTFCCWEVATSPSLPRAYTMYSIRKILRLIKPSIDVVRRELLK